MKANELMLGDWVAYRKDFPDRVNAIAIGGHAVSLEHDSWQQMSSIQPIPLTPEILKKNGFDFLYSSVPGGTPQEQRMRKVDTYEWRGIAVNYYHETNDFQIVNFRGVRINYVHQFQHALRLCGIEKEIVL